MRRRDLLASAPALLAGSLSGCLSGTGTDTPRAETATDRLPPSGYGSLSEFDAGDPFASRRVGERAPDRHHRIAVWNDDSERRPLRVTLRDVDRETVVVDAERTFPAYGSLLVEVYRRADYVFEVTLAEADGRTLGVRRGFIDCNDSATHVAVRPDGSVRARVVSTALACRAATANASASGAEETADATAATPTPTPR